MSFAAGLAITILLAPAMGATPADVGVGITAQPIVLADAAHPGGRYQLGPVTVVNTGTDPATVSLRVAAEPGGAQAIPANWVQFGQNSVRLAGGAQASVRLQLVVPEKAGAGQYQSLVYAGLTSEAGPGANGVGAEAATRLSFTVSPAPAQGSATTSPPAALGLVVAVLGVAGLLTARRHGGRRGRHLATNR